MVEYDNDDNGDEKKCTRKMIVMILMMNRTHPTTISGSDLLSQLRQLRVHEGDVVLT